MRRVIVLPFVLLLASCSSLDLPTVEESQKRIASLQSMLPSVEAPITDFEKRFRMRNDLSLALRIDALNRVSKAIATQRSDDMTITFLATRPLMEEKKSVLGISYTNRLDIDSGRVVLNLRRFEFLESRGGQLTAALELSGQGRLHVSGKYTGVPGSASPAIDLSLRDTVRFDLLAGDNGSMQLKPRPRRVLLKATFRVNFLGWDIPWSEDIPLEFHKLLQPMTIPSVFDAAMNFPLPPENYSVKSYEFERVPLRLENTVIDVLSDRLLLRADVHFRSK